MYIYIYIHIYIYIYHEGILGSTLRIMGNSLKDPRMDTNGAQDPFLNSHGRGTVQGLGFRVQGLGYPRGPVRHPRNS